MFGSEHDVHYCPEAKIGSQRRLLAQFLPMAKMRIFSRWKKLRCCCQ